VVEACELLDYLYGFDHIDDPNRYSMAEHFRDDAVRMVVLHFHLSSEELLKALTYEAIRDVAGPETFSDDQDIKYLQQLRTGEAIDLAARLRVIGKRTHKLLVELNALRNRASHYWVLSRYPSGSKRAMKARSRPRYPLEWKNKLLTPKRCKTEFIPVYGALYLDMWMAYYGDEDDPPPRELLT
jgi:hypothetical protein